MAKVICRWLDNNGKIATHSYNVQPVAGLTEASAKVLALASGFAGVCNAVLQSAEYTEDLPVAGFESGPEVVPIRQAALVFFREGARLATIRIPGSSLSEHVETTGPYAYRRVIRANASAGLIADMDLIGSLIVWPQDGLPLGTFELAAIEKVVTNDL